MSTTPDFARLNLYTFWQEKFMHSIIYNDFCFMRQGQIVKNLSPHEASLLEPVVIKNAPFGRALLLIHGFGSSPAVYREIIPQLTSYDAIFCPLLPGHGQSLQKFSETKREDWLRFIEHSFDEIAQNYQMIDVVGLSLGGLLACHLAKTKPIHRLFLLAPALALNLMPCISSRTVKLMKCLGLKCISNHGGSLLSEHQSELTFRKLPLSSISEIFQLVEQFEFVPFMQKTIVCFGKYDKVIHHEKVQTLLKRLDQLSIVWLDHSAHVLPLDNDRQSIIELIGSS